MSKQSQIRDAVLRRFGSNKARGDWREIDCPACNKPAAAQKCAVNVSTLAWKCFACDGKGNAYDLVKDIVTFDAPAREDFSPLEKAIYGYRKQSGKNWRLSDAVVNRFKIHFAQAGKFYAPVWPGPDGAPARYLAVSAKRTGWNAIPGVGRVLLGGEHLPPSGMVVFVEGEWDLAAAWEAWKLPAVYVTGGAAAVGAYTDTTALLGGLRSGHEVVIFYDSDQAGATGGSNLAANIWMRHKVKSIKVVDWSRIRKAVPGVERARAGADLEDAIRGGLTLDQFQAIVAALPAYSGAEAPAVRPVVGLARGDGAACPPLPAELESLAPVAPYLWSARYLPRFERVRAWDRLFKTDPDLVSEVIGADAFSLDPEKIYAWFEEIFAGPMPVAVIRHAVTQAIVAAAIKRERGKGRMGGLLVWKFNGTHYEEADDSDRAAAVAGILDRIGFDADSPRARSQIRSAIRAELDEQIASAPVADILTHFDVERMNLADGVLNMRTLELSPHSPEYLFRAVNSEIAWANSESGCPAWHDFAERALGPEQTREFWKFIYTTIAHFPRLQIAAFFIGSGGSGKGVAAKMIKTLVGAAYTSALSVDDLEHDFKAFSIVGKALNIWEEIGGSGHFSSEWFKKITGLSEMTVNGKFRDAFNYVPFAQWVVTTNSPPNPSDYSEATLRRTVLFQFAPMNPADRSASYFDDVLAPQAAAALRFALTEGRAWFLEDEKRFNRTDATHSARQSMVDGDSIAGFWDEWINAGPPKDILVPAEWDRWWHYVRGTSSAYNLDIGFFYAPYAERATRDGQKAAGKPEFSRRSKDFWERFFGEACFRGDRWVRHSVQTGHTFRLDSGRVVKGLRLEYASTAPLADLAKGERPVSQNEPF